MDQTADGARQAGAVGAIIEWDSDRATVDLSELVRQVKIVARHNATVRQREVAQQRALAAYRRLPARTRLAMNRKSVRYLAVETERDAQSRGRKSVMIWDTQASRIVGNSVYDIAENPVVGTTCRFETYAATYVGAGFYEQPEAQKTPPAVAAGPR